MSRTIVIVAGILGFLGVAIGAFGAHAWRSRLPEERLAHVHTAVRYLFATLPGSILIAVLAADCEGGLFETIGAWSFGIGVVLFSGSLIVLALTGRRRWGAITPFGGVLLLLGWASVVAAAALTSGIEPGFIAVYESC
jgi:uncharacterized membrane protein YgdD (TMEM256/DUF423 family)